MLGRLPRWQIILALTAVILLAMTLFRGGTSSPSALFHSAPSRTPNPELTQKTPRYIRAIMDPADTSFARLECPNVQPGRYDGLKAPGPHTKYFFALALHQAGHMLPRLLSSVIETIRFLGPESCVLSIAEWGSDDGTWEILEALVPRLQKAKIQFNLSAQATGSPVEARNRALAPLLAAEPGSVNEDATVIFLDAVAACAEDILELVYQRLKLGVTLACGVDWEYAGGSSASFKNLEVARTVKGDVFAESRRGKMFTGDEHTRTAFDAHQPFQVYSCWSGAGVFAARAVLGEKGVAFRAPRASCAAGEETLAFSADLWTAGTGRVAVVPSVNLAWSDEAAKKVKVKKGYVIRWTSKVTKEAVAWGDEAPARVRCFQGETAGDWVAWDEI
jgi:alpha-1,3-mannosyltransferase